MDITSICRGDVYQVAIGGSGGGSGGGEEGIVILPLSMASTLAIKTKKQYENNMYYVYM